MSLGSRIRLCAAQLNTNNQSTFSNPRNLTCRRVPVCFNHPKPFSISQRRLRLIAYPRLPRGSAVQVAAAVLVVLGNVRGHIQFPYGAHESSLSYALVGAHSNAARTALLLLGQHQQRGIALCAAVCMSHHRRGDQPVVVLDQSMAKITQLRLFAVTLLVKPRIGISGGLTRIVAALLSAKLLTLFIVKTVLGAKTLLRGPGLDQRAG